MSTQLRRLASSSRTSINSRNSGDRCNGNRHDNRHCLPRFQQTSVQMCGMPKVVGWLIVYRHYKLYRRKNDLWDLRTRSMWQEIIIYVATALLKQANNLRKVLAKNQNYWTPHPHFQMTMCIEKKRNGRGNRPIKNVTSHIGIIQWTC